MTGEGRREPIRRDLSGDAPDSSLRGGFFDGVRALLRSRWKGLGAITGAGVLLVLSGTRPGAAGAAGAASGFAFLMAFAVPVLLTNGVVSGDLRSGAALLWLQKPVGRVGLYLGRFLEALAGTLLAVSLATGAGATWAFFLGPGGANGAEELLGALPILLLLALLTATVTFGFSATGIRADGALTVIYLVLMISISALSMAEPRPEGVAAELIRRASFPLAPILEIRSWIAGEEVADPLGSLARVAIYETVWLVAALLLTAWTTRSPRGPFGD